MIHKIPLVTLSLLAVCCLASSGCGSAKEEPESTTVITPSETKPAETESAAEPEAAAEPVAESEPAAEEPAGEASPMPETAATPAEEPEPAASETETAEASSEAAETPTEQTAAKVSAESTDGATFRGRVVVKGTVPPQPDITPSGNDQFCIALKTIPSEEVVVGEENGLANVFVWVRKVPSGIEAPAAPEEPAVLDQKNCRFFPRALVAQVGQPLIVKNDDATSHNTRITGLSVSFNSIVGPNNREGVEVDFQRPEIVPVPVKCDIHGWMSCRILFTDNPWNAVTDKNGNFEITGLPAGEFEFRMQHEKAGYVEKSLKLKFEDGQTIEQTFEVDAVKLTD